MMQLSDYTLSLLDDIERRIDPDAEEDFRAQWRRFWYGGPEGSPDMVFVPWRKTVSQPGIELRSIHINDALQDWELMLDAELADVSRRLAAPTPALGMRANYGSAIMTTLLGAELFVMPRETGTLPTSRSFNDTDKIRAVLQKGIPDLHDGLGGDVLRFGERCAEIFAHYPKIRRYVEVYHPDTQGPLDVAELLWGGEMFYEMYDDGDLVHGLMRLVTDTYKAFMDKWFSIIPRREEMAVHWGILHRGNVFLRLDSGMNLSPEFYREYSMPYDRELLDYYGGGCIHFCGRSDHLVPSLCEIDSLHAIQASQPHLNDMNAVLAHLRASGKKILMLPDAKRYIEEYAAAGNGHLPLEYGMIHS